jgi:hypothetical protein
VSALFKSAAIAAMLVALSASVASAELTEHGDIELSSGGHLDTRGLPVCPLPRLEATSRREALVACVPSPAGGGVTKATSVSRS